MAIYFKNLKKMSIANNKTEATIKDEYVEEVPGATCPRFERDEVFYLWWRWLRMDPSCLWLPILAEKEAERKRKGQAARAYHTERKRVQGQEPAPTAEGGLWSADFRRRCGRV